MPNSELYKITKTLQDKAIIKSAPVKTLASADLLAESSASLANSLLPTVDKEGLAIVRPVKYTVPMTAVYDRLSDGTYIPKFENYLGATGNEDRLAKQQSSGEQWGHGLTKMLGKTAIYATDAIVGTAYGIGAAIGTGKLSKLFDNDFSAWADDTNKRMDNNFANYYTDEQKSMGLLKSMGTANFWANDVGGGLAFVGGAVLSGYALGALTGTKTLAKGGAKLGLKLANKADDALSLTVGSGVDDAAKSLLTNTLNESAERIGKNAVKERLWSKVGSGLGSTGDKALFFARTSSFEAGMEARQSFKENVDAYYQNYVEKHGHYPPIEEAQLYLDKARAVSNGVYGANLAVLSVSNAVMFGKQILPKYVTNKLAGVTNQINRSIGLGVKTTTDATTGAVVKSLYGANKAQKILGNVYKLSQKPISEGLYEEGFQGVITKTANDYLEKKYDPKSTESYSLLSGIADSFNEQYGTNEGWKEIGVGMIIGFGGGLVSGQLPEGLGKTGRKATEARLQTSVEAANKGIETFRSLNRAGAAKSIALLAQNNTQSASGFENVMSSYNFIKSQEHLSKPSEIEKDGLHIIDAQDYSELAAEHGIQESELKAQLKDDFQKTLKNYKAANDYVARLGLNEKIKDTPGNINEIGEHLALSFMLGNDALDTAKVHADNLDEIIGGSGTFSTFNFYKNLDETHQKFTADVLAHKENLKKLQEEAISLGAQAATLNDKNSEEARKVVSEKAVLTQKQILKTQAEITRLTDILGSATSVYLSGLKNVDEVPTSINDILDRLSTIESYQKDVNKSGNTAQAQTLNYLINQVQFHLDAHKEAQSNFQKMMSTNFFQSVEGKRRVNGILGKKYVMSEDYIKTLKDNDEKISESLDLIGIRSSDPIEKQIQDIIGDNAQLSEREKHRIESLVRLQLNQDAAQKMSETLFEASEEVTAETRTTIEGDDIALAAKLDLKNKDLTNAQVLSEAIDSIMTELDAIINENARDQDTIDKLNAELEKLKEQRDALTQQALSTSELSVTEDVVDELKTDIANINQIILSEGEGVQSLVRERLTSLLEFLNTTLALNIPSELFQLEKFKDLLEYIKSNKDIELKIQEYLKDNTVEFSYSDDGSIQFKVVKNNNLIEGEKPSNEDNTSTQQETPSAEDIVDSTSIETKKTSVQENESFTDNEQAKKVNTVPIEEVPSNTKTELEAKIKEIENQISKLQNGTKLVESKDYKRFVELTKKKESESLTEAEQTELQELKMNLDKWTMLTGIVIDGLRLSDLVEQRIVLEDTPISPLVDAILPETKDVVDEANIEDKQRSSGRKYGLVYDAAMVSVRGDDEGAVYTIYHVTEDEFKDILDNAGIEVEYTMSEDGRENIELTQEQVDLINDKTPLTIQVDTRVSNYSTVLEEVVDMNGDTVLKPLSSTYKKEFNNQQGHTIEAVYNANPGDSVTVVINPKDDFNKGLLATFINLKAELEKNKNDKTKAKAIRAKIAEHKQLMQESLLLTVQNEAGEIVATLKGIRGGISNANDELFDDFRRSVLNNEDTLEALSDPKAGGVIVVRVEHTDGSIKSPLIKVEKVLFGQPNFNYSLNEEGKLSIDSKPLTDGQQKAIVDIGYSADGKTFTRDHEAVDTTYLNRLTKRSVGKKIPFVVLLVGGKRVAYPVKLEQSKTADFSEFKEIYNADTTDNEKAKALNRYMAEQGINIKDQGNAFVAFGNTNLTDNFFNEKLAQLEAINYFYNVDDWISQDTPMEEVVKNQITVDIDVLNPFHSPKLSFDYSEMNIKRGKITKGALASKTNTKTDDGATTSALFNCK